jgi:hypothetical protein
MPKEQMNLFTQAEQRNMEPVIPIPRIVALDHSQGEPTKIVQHVLWDESVAMVKASVDYRDFAQFAAAAVEMLPQNSEGVRKKYVSYIARRFFPHGELRQFAPLVWKAYRDEGLLREAMQLQFLAAEPVVAGFHRAYVHPRRGGEVIPEGVLQEYCAALYGARAKDSRQAVREAIVSLGLATPLRGQKGWMRAASQASGPMFLLAFHLFLAQTPPAVVPVADVLAHPFWKLLDVPDERQVLHWLSAAAQQGLVARLVQADQLHQVTTCLSLMELLKRKVRLK